MLQENSSSAYFGRSEGVTSGTFTSSTKFRAGTLRHAPAAPGVPILSSLPIGDNSPQGSRAVQRTPFFCYENTDHKYTQSGHSVKEFSLGKPNK